MKNNQELYKLFEEEKASSINNFQAHLSSDELEFDEFIKSLERDKMKRIVCKNFGPVDDLVWEETDDLSPQPNEVVIEIKAAH